MECFREPVAIRFSVALIFSQFRDGEKIKKQHSLCPIQGKINPGYPGRLFTGE
jgi:hypothetical protein